MTPESSKTLILVGWLVGGGSGYFFLKIHEYSVELRGAEAHHT